jgi:hypothetical protein
MTDNPQRWEAVGDKLALSFELCQCVSETRG